MRDNATVPISEVSMFETFKSFISDFVEGEKHPSQFADNDYRLAAAALLVHAAAIDGEISQRERDKLHNVIKQRFALNEQAADELIAKATEAEHESVDLYHFTRLLNRSLDEPGRVRVIEMSWRIICYGAPPICSACRRLSGSSCVGGSAVKRHEAGRPDYRRVVRHR